MIIGIAGKARSGKDTIAKMLVDKYDFYQYALAKPIKETINSLFGWNERHSDGDLKEVIDPYWKFSPRQAYQKFGTEFARSLNNDVWVMMAERFYQGTDKIDIVISDIRFENESNLVRKYGYLIHVDRKNIEKVNNHASENGVEIKKGDYTIFNNGTIEDLEINLDCIMKLIGGVKS